jgi:hypothetical protein
MALPSSGVLTLNDIQTEFGGTNPIDLSEYYRGGSLVPDTALNAGIPTSGVISVTDFYGATNLINLNFVNHGVASGASGSVSIGTARGTRMVHLAGYTTNATFPTSVSIGGVTATLITRLGAVSTNGQAGNIWQAYAKVPTGTTATVTISTTATYYVSTFDTVNSGASNTGNSNASTTFTFTAANPGICFWGCNAFEPITSGANSLSTNSPGGVTYQLFRSGTAQVCLGYNITSTAASQTFTASIAPGKIGGAGAVASIFSAN